MRVKLRVIPEGYAMLTCNSFFFNPPACNYSGLRQDTLLHIHPGHSCSCSGYGLATSDLIRSQSTPTPRPSPRLHIRIAIQLQISIFVQSQIKEFLALKKIKISLLLKIRTRQHLSPASTRRVRGRTIVADPRCSWCRPGPRASSA